MIPVLENGVTGASYNTFNLDHTQRLRLRATFHRYIPYLGTRLHLSLYPHINSRPCENKNDATLETHPH